MHIDSTYPDNWYQLKDWRLDKQVQTSPSKAYNDCFCFVLVHSGRVAWQLGHRHYELHSGQLIVDKPDYEYTLLPGTAHCTVFNFSKEWYASLQETCDLRDIPFFKQHNILADKIPATAAIEYLHTQIQQGGEGEQLKKDTLVLELLRLVITGLQPANEDIIPHIGKDAHLYAIERAKQYLLNHFTEDISLAQLARHAYVSPFYLSRLFKTMTGLPPHQYLREIRFKHAAMLISNTHLPIADIAYAAGFGNTDYFTAAFTRRFKVPPTRYHQRYH
ncbi:AraC family transcriptional regulator [Chitinophaga pendula]|uniref:helix-turn-helix transcriptional regulator n=1 Tax=Chitinophaga TaxID=79328 RepID=UPI000BAFCA29|nr:MULTISPECIES: AraC family transcriptional regulator [Chitinophaga]ASZ13231.1 hypothetical protein CK934_20825 [Chitinophaga sp. MD30]UCJ09150.1 AraC family transcriptional regulator [Chitinophaga pendula]